jgi:hypothetical protein
MDNSSSMETRLIALVNDLPANEQRELADELARVVRVIRAKAAHHWSGQGVSPHIRFRGARGKFRWN